MRGLLLLGVVCGCNQDTGLNQGTDLVDEGKPIISADPLEIAIDGVCGVTEQVITVSNVGLGILDIDDITLDGSGWELSEVNLPIGIPAGESTTLIVTGTDGAATLSISSDDPDNPILAIELRAAANDAPVVTILAPAAGEVFAEDQEVTLQGTVTDDTDIAADLVVEWTTSLDGVLVTATPNPDGSTEYPWETTRSPGKHTVTLTAQDTCGGVGTSTVEVCQDGIATYDALGLDGWTFTGSARYDDEETWLELTATDQNVVGTAFETSELVDASYVVIDFWAYIGDGTGADGISLTALDTTRMDTFQGGTGCGIGYGGGADCTGGPALPGWSIEIDTFRNQVVDVDETDHLSFTFDGDLTNYETYVYLPEMENVGWHHVVVDVLAPHVYVEIDEEVYIDDDFDGNFVFPAYVGFTAGTGQLTNNHFIDALEVTDRACE